MRFKNLIFLSPLIFIFFTFCKKKTEVSGRVYSAKGFPMANTPVDLYKYGESSYPITMAFGVTKTNNDGYYYYTFQASSSHQRYYKIHCSIQDSGSDDHIISKGIANTINLKLHH